MRTYNIRIVRCTGLGLCHLCWQILLVYMQCRSLTAAKTGLSSEQHLWTQHQMPLLASTRVLPEHCQCSCYSHHATPASANLVLLMWSLCSCVLIIHFACVLFSWCLAELLYHFHQDIGIFTNSIRFPVCWVMDDYKWGHWDDAHADKCAGISSLEDIMHLTTDVHTKLVVQMFSMSEIMI